VTYLQLQAGLVEARYDFDPADSESVDRVPAGEFVGLLAEWRERVLTECALWLDPPCLVGPGSKNSDEPPQQESQRRQVGGVAPLRPSAFESLSLGPIRAQAPPETSRRIAP
jgi:hypothetical protein